MIGPFTTRLLPRARPRAQRESSADDDIVVAEALDTPSRLRYPRSRFSRLGSGSKHVARTAFCGKRCVCRQLLSTTISSNDLCTDLRRERRKSRSRYSRSLVAITTEMRGARTRPNAKAIQPYDGGANMRRGSSSFAHIQPLPVIETLGRDARPGGVSDPCNSQMTISPASIFGCVMRFVPPDTRTATSRLSTGPTKDAIEIRERTVER